MTKKYENFLSKIYNNSHNLTKKQHYNTRFKHYYQGLDFTEPAKIFKKYLKNSRVSLKTTSLCRESELKYLATFLDFSAIFLEFLI